MRKFLLTLILLSITQTAFAGYTKPYFRKDGTLVHGHYRSKSNQTKSKARIKSVQAKYPS